MEHNDQPFMPIPSNGHVYEMSLDQMPEHTRHEFEDIAAFLRNLSIYGNITESLMALPFGPGAVAAWRKEPQFKDAFQAAKDLHSDRVRSAFRQRAIEGYDEPIYHQGELVGYKRKFETRLFEVYAKAHCPEFRDEQKIDHTHTGRVMVTPPTAPEPSDLEKLADELSQEDDS